LSSIWDEWNLVWTIQSEVIHGHDQNSRQRIHHLEAETKIQAVYDKLELLLPANQDHLFDDVETHLAFSTNSLQNWLNIYHGLFTDSISKAKRLALDDICSIRSCFTPA
jgi:hypothetical protein